MTTETLYKVLNDDGSCAHGGTGKWFLPHDKRPGRWMPAVNGKLIACLNGYHLCRASDLVYWLGPVIWEAEHDGDVLVAEDKLVVRRSRLLRRVSTWTEHSARLFAADCAEHVLSFFEEKYPNDTRPRQAIEAARLFAADNITAAAMIAAREAAWVAMEAAREVAGAAGEAAWVAALAARNAAWAAGESARESARKAAMEAAWTARKATGVAGRARGGHWAASEAALAAYLPGQRNSVMHCYGGHWAASEAALAAEQRWQTERILWYLAGGTDTA